MGSGPLGTFLSTGKASKLGYGDSERRADTMDGSMSGRKSIANRATTMFLLCPVIAISKTKLTGQCAATTLQVSTSLVYDAIQVAVHEFL
jgi:hypothetical protein